MNELDSVLQEIRSGWDIPGLAVGLVDGGEIVYSGCFGVQNLQTMAPVTRDTVFCVQSVSKCLVATAVMQMVERGLLALDALLIHSLPDFTMDDERFRRITLRQILSHTSGIPDLGEMDYVDWMKNPECDEGAAGRFVRGLRGRKLIADPGERFGYSNIAYNVLGHLLAVVSGKSFESVMREQVLYPAGMTHSTFLLEDVPKDRLAWPHLRSPGMKPNPVYPYHRADAPASSLHTTLVDLCHWCIACLNRGVFRGHTILSPAGYAQMWTPVARRGDPPDLYEEMGLGWTLGHYQGARTVCHGGAGFGGTAFLLLLPEANRAAVIFCNEESNAHLLAAYAAADVLIGQKPRVHPVSWMVPVSRALAGGGIAAAYDRYAEIKDRKDEYNIGAYDLINLSLQLITANQIDLAIEVLGLNCTVFPEHVDSLIERAKLFWRNGDLANAREDLLRALVVDPGNPDASSLLEQI